MFIIDDEINKKLDSITIFLTKNEIYQLIGYAKQLLEENPPSDHYHLSDEEYRKEITICLYDPRDKKKSNPIIQKLINEDK
jgi:hypothetical protein